VMGPFGKGTQGAFFLKVIGWSGGVQRVIIEHITRIHPSCAPDWPQPDEGVGDYRVIVDGDPQLTITTRADVPAILALLADDGVSRERGFGTVPEADDARIWAAAGSLPLYQRLQLVAARSNLVNAGAFGLATPRYQDIGFRAALKADGKSGRADGKSGRGD